MLNFVPNQLRTMFFKSSTHVLRLLNKGKKIFENRTFNFNYKINTLFPDDSKNLKLETKLTETSIRFIFTTRLFLRTVILFRIWKNLIVYFKIFDRLKRAKNIFTSSRPRSYRLKFNMCDLACQLTKSCLNTCQVLRIWLAILGILTNFRFYDKGNWFSHIIVSYVN